MEALPWSILLLALASLTLADLSSEYKNREVLSPKYKFYWTIDEGRQRINVAVEVEATGWVALGFANKIGNMQGYDVGIGYVLASRTPNTAELKDFHTDGHHFPPADPIQDLTLSGFSEVNGTTTLKYFRALDTKDKNDIPVKTGPMIVVWAYTNTADNVNQKHDAKGYKTITLMGGAVLGVHAMGFTVLLALALLAAWIVQH